MPYKASVFHYVMSGAFFLLGILDGLNARHTGNHAAYVLDFLLSLGCFCLANFNRKREDGA